MICHKVAPAVARTRVNKAVRFDEMPSAVTFWRLTRRQIIKEPKQATS